jgi:WD40 repeat protein
MSCFLPESRGASGPALLVGPQAWRVSGPAFVPESKVLASGGSDGEILLWDMDWSSLQRRACRIANRKITKDEWDQYLSLYYGNNSYHETCKELLKQAEKVGK